MQQCQHASLRKQIQDEIDKVCNGADLTVEHLMNVRRF